MNLTEVHRVLEDMFSKELTNALKRHVVFWYDEDGEFKEDIDALELDQVRIWKLTKNNLFATKYELETKDTVSHFLIYANMPQPLPDEDWLYNQYKMGQEFATDKLTIIMREIGVTDESLRDSFNEYRQFFNSNARLKAFAKLPVEFYTEEMIDLNVLAVLVKSKTNTLDDILKVILNGLLSETNHAWDQIQKFGNEEKFWNLMDKYYGYTLQDKSLSSLLIFFLLTYTAQQNEFIELPGTWEHYVSTRPTNIVVFMDQWMNHREGRAFYNALADKVSSQIRIDEEINHWKITDITQMDTFRLFDEEIIDYLVRQLLLNLSDFASYKKVISERRRSHWYPEYRNHYDAIVQAVQLFQTIREIEQFIPEQPAYNLFHRYVEDYYIIDQAYRKFYAAYDQVKEKEALYQLREKIENLYSNWYVEELAMKWEKSLEKQEESWSIDGISQQKNFFSNWIRPFQLDNERVFVIISDGLRFEIARQLMEELNSERRATTEINGIQSSLPSYTALGMASLLPHQELTLTKKGHIFCDSINSSGIENRDKVLKETAYNSIAIRFQDIKAMNRKSFRETFAGKKVVYIYHNTIDGIGDNQATEAGVFDAADEAISELRILVNQLVNHLSASNIIITADHGFLYQRDPVMRSQKVIQRSNDPVLKDKRFIVAENPLQLEGTAFYSMEGILSNGEDYYTTVPKGANRFAIQGGGVNYVHGGTMLQEIVLPVISFKNDRSKSTQNEIKMVDVKLTIPIRKITNPVTYLEFFQTTPVEDKVRPRYLTMYFIDETKTRISNEIRIIADSEAVEARERVFKERFIFKSKIYDRRKTYYLVLEDTQSGKFYEQYEFVIDITV